MLFYRIDASGKAVPCLSSDVGASFVGTSGIGLFKYVDDLPKNPYAEKSFKNAQYEYPQAGSCY